MRPSKIISCIVSIFGVCTLAPQICSQTPAQGQRIVIGASEVLDGKGRILQDVYIVVLGSKIVSVGPSVGPVDYDLRGLTVLPGWIDAHVHITWSFGEDWKNAGMGGTTLEDAYKNVARGAIPAYASVEP